jgi:hypothetical protein
MTQPKNAQSAPSKARDAVIASLSELLGDRLSTAVSELNRHGKGWSDLMAGIPWY